MKPFRSFFGFFLQALSAPGALAYHQPQVNQNNEKSHSKRNNLSFVLQRNLIPRLHTLELAASYLKSRGIEIDKDSSVNIYEETNFVYLDCFDCLTVERDFNAVGSQPQNDESLSPSHRPVLGKK